MEGELRRGAEPEPERAEGAACERKRAAAPVAALSGEPARRSSRPELFAARLVAG